MATTRRAKTTRVLTGRALTARDHTRIVQILMRNQRDLRGRLPTESTPDVLRRCARLGVEPRDAELLTRASRQIEELEETLRGMDRDHPLWSEGARVSARLFLADNGQELAAVLRSEAEREHSPAIRIGIRVAQQILEDGDKSIYSPPEVVYQMMDPRQGLGQLQSTAGKVKDKVDSVAAGDIVGAITGAVAGAVKGGMTGGAAGAAVGAGQGAVAGAAAGSAGEAIT